MLRTIRTPPIAVNMSSFRADPDYGACETQSQSQFRNRLKLTCSDDFWQQIEAARSPTRQKGVIYFLQSGATRMSRKALIREVVLAAILDVVLGFALLTGTIYVAALCLAVGGT